MKLLIIYPGKRTLGGMTTIVNQHIDYFTSKDIDVKTINTTSSRGFFEKYFLGFSSVFSFLYKIFIFRPDLVVIHYASGLSFVRKSFFILFSKLFKRKVVCHLHGGGFVGYYARSSSIVKCYIRFVLGNSTFNFVLGTLWKDFFIKELNLVNTCVIPNSFDFSKHTTTDICSKVFDLIYVGRVEKIKGVFDLVKALTSIECMKKVQFVGKVVEDGVPSFYLKGELPYDTVINLINDSKILCLPSYVEAFPLVVLEAISRNSIVVATDVGAVKDVLGEDYPFIFTPGDVESLTNILTVIINSPKESLERVRNNYQRCRDNYDSEHVLSELISKYYIIYKT